MNPLIPLTLLAGTLLSLQAGVNTRLRTGLSDPVMAALVSFVVGTAALALLAVARRADLPTATTLSGIPWWAWTGGFLGAIYVAGVTVVAPRLGVAALTALVVAGQLAMALVLDHFGWLGFARRPVDLVRVAGVAMVLGGAMLTLRK